MRNKEYVSKIEQKIFLLLKEMAEYNNPVKTSHREIRTLIGSNASVNYVMKKLIDKKMIEIIKLGIIPANGHLILVNMDYELGIKKNKHGDLSKVWVKS